MEALNPMAQTGMPTSSGDWWAATQGVTNRSIEDAIKNAAEQAGLGGMRWSTPLGYTAQDISGKYMGEAGQQWADREMAAQEAARQRQLEATGQLFQYGQGQYQMSSDEMARQAQARAMAAAAGARAQGQSNWEQQMAFDKQKWADQMGMAGASALGGVGSERAGLGLNTTQQLYNMGMGMQNAQQGAIDSSYKQPYMNYGQGYLSANQGVPQTYQPSTGAQLGGIFSGLGNLAGQAFGGGYQQYPVANTQFYT